VLWLDYVDYAERLLASGVLPWADVTGTVAWYRQAQGLLGSDVVVIPVWSIVAHLVTTIPSLPEQMRAKPRVTHALRAALSNDAVRDTSTGLARALRAVFPQALLAVTIPMPRLAIERARRAASGAPEEVTIGEDEIDTAAPYLADFLRGFGDVGLDVLLLEASSLDNDGVSGELGWCTPVLNTARHYGWDVGLSVRSADVETSTSDIDFVIARSETSASELHPQPVRVAGLTGAATFTVVAVPRDAAPERVLEALGRYRVGAG